MTFDSKQNFETNKNEEAKRKIEEKEKQEKQKRIEEDKNKQFFDFKISENYLYTNNMFIKDLLSKSSYNFKSNFYEEIIKILKNEYNYKPSYDILDYSTETILENVRIEDFVEAFKKVEKIYEEKEKEKKINKLKSKINELKKKIENNKIPFKNMVEVAPDLVTGSSYYTFKKRVPLEDFNKVRKYFEFIDTTKRGEDFDPMFYGYGFRGYATREPKKVLDILYPGWEEESLNELKEELTSLQQELKNLETN